MQSLLEIEWWKNDASDASDASKAWKGLGYCVHCVACCRGVFAVVCELFLFLGYSSKRERKLHAH